MIKNIIFDYGNVIFDIDHQLTISAFQDLGLQHDKAFFGHLQQNPLFDLFEMGKISSADFRNEVRKIADQNFSDETIDTAWNTLLLGIRPGYLEFLEGIKPLYRTFLLSNNNEIHYNWINEYLLKEFGIPNMSQYFEHDYYSHLMGLRKPNADIFQKVIDEQHIIAAETLFIDDSPQHLETAKSLGFKTHLMLRSEDLREVLPLLLLKLQ